MLYFEAASSTVLLNEECSTVTQLQVGLCLVLYFIHTSKPDLARPALKVISTSSMVQSLFNHVSAQHLQSQGALEVRAKDLMWSIIYLDLQLSSLLGLSPLLKDPGPEMATVYAVNSAAHNVANYRRSDSAFLLSVSMAMAIELLKIIRRTNVENMAAATQQRARPLNKKLSPVELRKWNILKVELETWEFMFQGIFPENDVNPKISL